MKINSLLNDSTSPFQSTESRSTQLILFLKLHLLHVGHNLDGFFMCFFYVEVIKVG